MKFDYDVILKTKDLNLLEQASNYCGLKCAVASNINCPLSILEKLSDDKNYKVVEHVALNENCSKELLKKLSTSKNYFVRKVIARNINSPEDALNSLSNLKYNNETIVSLVAQNKNCPIFILKKLSKTKVSSIAGSLVYNKNCTFEILKIIYKNHKHLREDIISHVNWKLKEFE